MGIDVMPLTNAGAGRIARLHRAGRLDEEEYSITLHLISGVYSSVWGFFFFSFSLKAGLFYRNGVCLRKREELDV